jgi:hypothetical protein
MSKILLERERMPDAPIPWFGLAALIAMFAIPFLPRWLFEGPRSVKHWPPTGELEGLPEARTVR